MAITAMLLAIGMVLPFLTGQIQAIARIISPLPPSLLRILFYGFGSLDTYYFDPLCCIGIGKG